METALSHFSDRQLEELSASGVRFWPSDRGMPPEISAVGVSGAHAPEAYIPETRVIHYRDSMTSARLTHELAHAYDDVHGERSPHRLDDLPLAARRAEVERLDREVSHHRAFASERDPSLARAQDSYRDGLPRGSGASETYDFDWGARAGYARTGDVHEFYAEGVAALHGSAERSARIERNAPELYRRLVEESRAEGTTPAWIGSDGHVIE